MRIICSLSLFFLFPLYVLAGKTMVSNVSEINGSFWYPGDTIVMQNGTWTNQTISFRAEGAAGEPVVLIAETPGEVILTGNSSISFSGKYIEVNGLYFKDGTLSGAAVVSFRTSSSSLAENCRLTNTTIENYNPPLNTTDSKWVSVYGEKNQIDHCSFINKTNSGTLLVVWLKSGVIPGHVIDHNYFGYRNPNLGDDGKELNGQEIIRIGDSSSSMQDARVIVSNNFFEHCNGEIEIISNKSCENIYSNNVFFECKGSLTLRHGNRCTVEGNYFIGNGIEGTAGVRIIGEDHLVYNNYFENLNGTGYRAGLCIVRGLENSELYEYFQVKNARVFFNTFVDCKQAFGINYNSSSTCKMPPIGTFIAHNHVYNTVTTNTNVTIYQTNVAEMDVTWKNNLMNQGLYSSFNHDTTQVITGIDPSMSPSGSGIVILEPSELSALSSYSTNDYPEVENDILGRDRGSEKIPGASQLSGATTREMPTRETAGSGYYSPTTSTGTVIPVSRMQFRAFATRNIIHTIVSVPGTLNIYDSAGRCLHQQKILCGSNTTTVQQPGIFILRFLSAEGELRTAKVFSN